MPADLGCVFLAASGAGFLAGSAFFSGAASAFFGALASGVFFADGGAAFVCASRARFACAVEPRLPIVVSETFTSAFSGFFCASAVLIAVLVSVSFGISMRTFFMPESSIGGSLSRMKGAATTTAIRMAAAPTSRCFVRRRARISASVGTRGFCGASLRC